MSTDSRDGATPSNGHRTIRADGRADRRADVRAAGAVLWRRTGAATVDGAVVDGPVGRVEVALVHRPRYDDWTLPKGKVDPGETLPFTAVREVAEETGFAAHLQAHLGAVDYRVPEGRKVVDFWSARAASGAFAAGEETDGLRWLDVATAAELLSYPRDQVVLDRFAALGTPSGVLVLVRHAKAGSREGWDGPDEQRPLSGRGRAQAAQLAALLPLFGPDRVLTAPPVRCVDTVTPAADALGLPVAVDPLLGEEAFAADADAVLARAVELAATPGVTVACSQGGVLPAILAHLLPDAPALRDPDGLPAKVRKASTWVLTTYPDPATRTLDHYPSP